MMAKPNVRVLAGAIALFLASGLTGILIGKLVWETGLTEPATGEELPESLSFRSWAEAKRALVEHAEADIKRISKYAREADVKSIPKYAERDPVVLGNCMAAMQEIRRFERNQKTRPLVIRGRIEEGKKETYLIFSAINSHRETNQIIILAKTDEGTIIKSVIQDSRSRKLPGLVSQRGVLVRFVPVSEIASSGVEEAPGEITVTTEFDLFAPVPLPEGLPLAVGIKDRNGQISSFARVTHATSGEPRHPVATGPRDPNVQ